MLLSLQHLQAVYKHFIIFWWISNKTTDTATLPSTDFLQQDFLFLWMKLANREEQTALYGNFKGVDYANYQISDTFAQLTVCWIKQIKF